MDAATAAFRSQYRASIGPGYNGWLHGLWIVGLALGLSAGALWRSGGGLPVWLSLWAALLVSHFGEWWLHKNALHRRRRGLSVLWHRHTVQHHHYFTATAMPIFGHRECRIVLFPPYALVLLALIHAASAALWSLPFGAAAGYGYFAGGLLHYFAYELFHFAAHLPDWNWLRRVPLINTVRRHHREHHRHEAMAQCNFNLTPPFADWCLGSTDRKAGLLATLFGGDPR